MIIENVNKIERESDDTWMPQLVGDNIPDNFTYAPAPGLEFEYMVVGPYGNNIIESSYANAIELKAESFEYEGKYYWSYLQKMHYYENAPESAKVNEGVWTSTTYEYFNLSYYNNRYNGGIYSAEKNIEDMSTDVVFWIQPNLIPFSVYEEEGEEPIVTDEYPDFHINEWLNLMVDEVEVYSALFYDDNKDIVEADGKPYYEKHFIKTNIPADREEQITELVIDSHIANGYITPGWDEEYRESYSFYPLNPYKKNFIMNLEYDPLEKVTFDDTLISSYTYPYKLDTYDEVINEEFIFTKEFANKYKYPTTTKEIMTLEYKDDNIEPVLALPNEINGKIKLDGYEDENIKIKTSYEGDGKYLFYVDDEMYYDQDEHVVKDGKQTGPNNFTENGIIIPWDMTTSGTISFQFSVDTYQKHTFEFTLRIGNENKLRGSNGKYEIVEVNDEE